MFWQACWHRLLTRHSSRSGPGGDGGEMLSQIGKWPSALRPIREGPCSRQPLPYLPHPGLLQEASPHLYRLHHPGKRRGHSLESPVPGRGTGPLCAASPSLYSVHRLHPCSHTPLGTFTSKGTFTPQTSLPQGECFSKCIFLRHLSRRGLPLDKAPQSQTTMPVALLGLLWSIRIDTALSLT